MLPIKKFWGVRLFLAFSAVLQVGYWSLSHLFFPQWYFHSIGGSGLVMEQRFVLLFMNEIGILILGISFATFLAALDPIRNFAIVLMLYVVSLGSILVSLVHICFLHMAQGEWVTVSVLAVQLALLTILYPWRALIKNHVLA